MYTLKNYPTKKGLIADLADGVEVRVYQPNDHFGTRSEQFTGTAFLEGPHSPQPHTWYAQAECRDGKIVRLLK